MNSNAVLDYHIRTSYCITYLLIFMLGAKTVSPRSYLESGPIFLDQLFCTDSDTNLQGCARDISGIALTTCNHTEDVWLQCSGR